MSGKYLIYLYWELSRSRLEELYETARRERVLTLTASDIEARRFGPDEFELFARKADIFGAAYDLDERPLGFFYLTAWEGHTARIHFNLFKAGREHRQNLGRLVLDWCFDTFDFQCLIGVVPAINGGACRYAREMGGREMGRIPGMCWIDRLKRSVGGVQFIFERTKSDVVIVQ